MSFQRLSIPAALVATVLGTSAASACATADLAGDWFATFQRGANEYCTLSVGADGVIGASGCWHEKITATPAYTIAGTLAVSDACLVSATLTSAKPTAKGDPKHGGGHNGGQTQAVTLSAKLLVGAETANGLLTRANGEFSPVVFTRVK